MKKSISVILLIFIVGAIFTGCGNGNNPKKQVIADFNTIVGEVQALQQSLNDKIAEGEKLLSETKESDVADASVLTKLSSALEAGKADQPAEIPAIAETNDMVNEQIEAINITKNDLQAKCDLISTCITNIGKSKSDLVAKREEERKAGLSPKNIYVSTITDSDGYVIQVTLKLTDWIKGSEYDLLNSAWKDVGGGSDFPKITRCDGIGPVNMDATVFAVGTVSVKNATPGFDITETSGPKVIIFDIYGNTSSAITGLLRGRNYSNTGIEYNSHFGTGWIRPNMTRNNWGPVPVFIGAHSIFTPNFPNGNPSLDSLEIYYYKEYATYNYKGIKERITLGKTW